LAVILISRPKKRGYFICGGELGGGCKKEDEFFPIARNKFE
jgi:hypothetical protein